jgi:DNA-binding NarL/FixJ family response regulator
VVSRSSAVRSAAIVVDDHPLFRLGFVAAWRRARPSEPIEEAIDLASARRLIEERTRLVVLDLLLPDGFGLELAPFMTEHRVPFVVLSSVDGPAVVEAARRCGAAGLFSKELEPDLVLYEIDRLLHDPDARAFPEHATLPALSARERDVLAGLFAGRGNREIAADLGLGLETIKSHAASLFARLGATDRLEAVRVARELGYDLALPYLGEPGWRSRS